MFRFQTSARDAASPRRSLLRSKAHLSSRGRREAANPFVMSAIPWRRCFRQRPGDDHEDPMNTLTGKTIRWTFADGPVAGVTFEHVLHEDGSVTWRYVGGEHKGATAREKSYAAVKVNDKTWVISYLAAS